MFVVYLSIYLCYSFFCLLIYLCIQRTLFEERFQKSNGLNPLDVIMEHPQGELVRSAKRISLGWILCMPMEAISNRLAAWFLYLVPGLVLGFWPLTSNLPVSGRAKPHAVPASTQMRSNEVQCKGQVMASVPKVLFYTRVGRLRRWIHQKQKKKMREHCEICDLAPPRCGPGIGHEIGILFQGASSSEQDLVTKPP